MSKQVKAIRGMNDITPDESGIWQFIENALTQAANSYHYREIRFPIVEFQQLFSRAVGDVTDIVEKEMYVFEDRNKEVLALRPEGTAGCVRAAIQQNLLYNQTQRLWYLGPMFRYERPQLGRSRQFHQFGVECFGFSEAYADAEVIAMSARAWNLLGIQEHVTLEINSLGSLAARNQYKDLLVNYFKENFDALDEDSQRRLDTNPLRILDSKNPALKSLIDAAPKLHEHIDEEDKQHFETVLALLDKLNIPYKINPCLVRGLDYYNRTVFEWTTDKLGAQATICAGGRYDNLVEWLGGKAAPATGWAAGLERIKELVKTVHAEQSMAHRADVYFINQGDAAREQAMLLSEQCRQALPQLSVLCHLGEGSFKSQFKRADQSGAQIAFILGDDEVAQETVGVKFLRETREQTQLAQNELITFLQNELARSEHAHV